MVIMRKLRNGDSANKMECAFSSGKIAGGEAMVIGLLNMKRNPPAKRVADLVEAFRQAAQVIEAKKADPSSAGRRFWAFNIKELMELNARISRFRWQPAIFGFTGAGPLFKVHYGMVGKLSTDPLVAMERHAVQWIVDHVDLVHRLRRCAYPRCGKWFFGKNDRQKYCKDSCRQGDASQGESFKEKRRKYMKQYRRKEKEENARSLRIARGKTK